MYLAIVEVKLEEITLVSDEMSEHSGTDFGHEGCVHRNR